MTTVDSDPFDKVASVDVDDEGGARAAAEHLIELGHRDVVVVGIERAEHAPSGAEDVVARRLRGYRTALTAVGVDDTRMATSSSARPLSRGGVAAFERAWEAGRRPTAVLAMSDAIAIGAIRALRDHGLSIPRDVSVVGFDDIELAQTTDPPLTTVHQPIRGKGEEAARLLSPSSQARASRRDTGGWRLDSSSGRRQDRRPLSKGGERGQTEVHARRGPPGIASQTIARIRRRADDQRAGPAGHHQRMWRRIDRDEQQAPSARRPRQPHHHAAAHAAAPPAAAARPHRRTLQPRAAPGGGTGDSRARH